MNKTIVTVISILALATIICFSIYSNNNRYHMQTTDSVLARWVLDKRTGNTALHALRKGEVVVIKSQPYYPTKTKTEETISENTSGPKGFEKLVNEQKAEKAND